MTTSGFTTTARAVFIPEVYAKQLTDFREYDRVEC